MFEILFRVDIVCLCWTVAEIGNEQKTETISIGSRSTGKDYKIVCYYTNWSQYRPKIGKYLPEDVEADLCTHIIFAFGWLKKGKLSSLESNDETKDGKVGLYERINAFKKINPRLKVLLAIGKRPRHGSSPTTGRPADEIAHLDLPQVAGRSARPSSRRCRPRATLARRSSSAPSRSSGSTTLTDSTSTGNTPRAPTTSATLSSSSKVPDPINRSKSTITAHVSTLETSNSNNGRCFSIPTQISLLKDHPKRVAPPKLDRLGFCFFFFFAELREAFEAEAQELKIPRLLLTAAVPVGPDNINGGYDVPAVASQLDFINLMAYDFHGKWESQAGHNAPLYAPSSDRYRQPKIESQYHSQRQNLLHQNKETEQKLLSLLLKKQNK